MPSPSSYIKQNLTNDIVVRAGAGAGKTTWLTNQVFDIADKYFNKHGRMPRIVVSTFTRKATQELRERLVMEACRRQRSDLIHFVSSPSSLFITTIHGILSQFIRRYGHLLDFDNNFQVMTDEGAQLQSLKILKSLVEDELVDAGLVEELGFKKLSAYCRNYYSRWLEEPSITAVTKDDLSKILARSLYEYSRVLHFLVATIKGQTEDAKWVQYADGLLQVAACLESKELENPAASALEALKACGRKPLLSKKEPQLEDELHEQLKAFIEDMKKALSSESYNTENWAQYFQAFESFQSFAPEFCERFLEEKQLSGQLEIQDLELLVAKALRDHPQLGQDYSQFFDHWLIDEFQDTSPIQVSLLRHLVGEKPMYVVGDPQQSIYFFRGADSKVFDELEKAVRSSGGKNDTLKKNYRSVPELLTFFNDFFSQLGNQFSPMVPREPVSEPSRQICEFAIIEKSEDQEMEHLRAIASRVLNLLDNGATFDEICILSRTNKLLEEVSRHLNELNVPTIVHSASGYYNRREVQDCTFILKVMANPHDNFSLIGLLRSPWVGWSDQEITNVANEVPNGESLWKYLVTSGKLPEPLAQLVDKKKRLGLVEGFTDFVLDSGLVLASRQYDPTGRRESNIWKYVHQLKQEESRPGFNVIDFISHVDFAIDDLDSVGETDAVAAVEPNRVNLMTIHASKGLKFKHIIVPNMHKRPNVGKVSEFSFDRGERKWAFNLPLGEGGVSKPTLFSQKLMEKEKEIELLETDRLLYVALTRAVESVFMCFVDDPGKNSWVERMRIDLSKKLQSRRSYTYTVQTGPFEVKPYAVLEDSKDSGPEKPFRDSQDSEASQPLTFSVSSLLEEESFVSNESAGPRDTEEIVNAVLKTANGTLIHQLMEALKVDFNFDFSKVAEEWFGEKAGEILSAVEFVRNLKQPNLKSVIENGFVEWGFQMLTEKGIMEGQIDLWGQDNDGVTWLIDYKSGSERYKRKLFNSYRSMQRH
ncbi:MAG: UvrD-helicase domain-containing protein [Bdellovibrionales bacterium]